MSTTWALEQKQNRHKNKKKVLDARPAVDRPFQHPPPGPCDRTRNAEIEKDQAFEKPSAVHRAP